MTNIATTNLPGGITNAVKESALSAYGAPDPTIWHSYLNDFDVFTSGDWSGAPTGSVTNAIIAGNGGILSMINSAASADLNPLQLKVATFAMVAGSQSWLKARFSLSNATNAQLVLGLIQTTATPLTVTDGFYFAKAAASTTLTAKLAKSSAISTVNVGTLANATSVNVGLHYDGNAAVNVFLNNVKVASLPVANLPTVNLNLTMAVSNGTAAANTLNVDYILVSQERPSTLL